MSWRIYYSDKPTFSSDDGSIKDAPARGVQVILQDHPDVGVEIVTGDDFYVWRNGRWFGLTHVFDLWDYLVETGLVKLGRMLTQDEYNAVMEEALGDQHEWKKTGYLPGERKTTDR